MAIAGSGPFMLQPLSFSIKLFFNLFLPIHTFQSKSKNLYPIIDAILLQLTVEKIILSDGLTTLKIGTSLIEYNYLDPFPKTHVRKLYILSVSRKINAFETLHDFSDLR